MIPFGGIAKLDSPQQYNLHLENCIRKKRKDKQHTNSGASLVQLSQL